MWITMGLAEIQAFDWHLPLPRCMSRNPDWKKGHKSSNMYSGMDCWHLKQQLNWLHTTPAPREVGLEPPPIQHYCPSPGKTLKFC